MDIEMPLMNGEQVEFICIVAKVLMQQSTSVKEKENKTSKLFQLSDCQGMQETERIQEAHESGMTDYIVKPYQKVDLYTRLLLASNTTL